MEHIKEVEKVITAALNDGADTIERGFADRYHTLPTPRICLEDIRGTWQVKIIAAIANTLRQLKGRKVRDVYWSNILDQIFNPHGTVGHFVFVLETWQPIEIAPKDGKSVLLFSPSLGIFKGEWFEIYGHGRWSLSDAYGDGHDWPDVSDVTHWMPLPEPPAHV